jgi:GDP-4-dehydro-6-deoxy-D-mannose reductase
MQFPASPERPRPLVTGVTGFAGSFLAEALLARGEAVVGLARRASWPPGCEHLAGRVELLPCDLCDAAAAEAVLRRTEPTHVYHLAGYAQVGPSFREPEAAWDGNLTATRRLFQAIGRWGPLRRPRVLFVGSGLIYGDTGPVGAAASLEDAPLRPQSPYAASKAAADLASYQASRDPSLEVIRARPFNHIGPRQSPQFAVASFARQLVAIERGAAPSILETGNLRAERDLTDVRDTVAAYLLLMERGRPGEAYNVASGRCYSMQVVLDLLVSLSGVRVQVRQRAELVRPTDQAVVRGEAGKLARETGWSPRYLLERTLADTLDYWRSRADAGGAPPGVQDHPAPLLGKEGTKS